MNFVLEKDWQADVKINYFYKAGLNWVQTNSPPKPLNKMIISESDIGRLKGVGDGFEVLLTSEGWVYL